MYPSACWVPSDASCHIKRLFISLNELMRRTVFLHRRTTPLPTTNPKKKNIPLLIRTVTDSSITLVRRLSYTTATRLWRWRKAPVPHAFCPLRRLEGIYFFARLLAPMIRPDAAVFLVVLVTWTFKSIIFQVNGQILTTSGGGSLERHKCLLGGRLTFDSITMTTGSGKTTLTSRWQTANNLFPTFRVITSPVVFFFFGTVISAACNKSSLCRTSNVPSVKNAHGADRWSLWWWVVGGGGGRKSTANESNEKTSADCVVSY